MEREHRNSIRSRLGSFLICLMFIVAFYSNPSWAADPWQVLQERYKDKTVSNVPKKLRKGTDPWERLWIVCLPFTEETEAAALVNPKAGIQVYSYLHRALLPYKGIIHEAAGRFDIPEEIIGAVIMVESGGDPNAKASTSTASGLMQTISSTFQEARNGLMSRGILIDNNPFDPYASIMAGTWYLDRMFEKAADDRKEGLFIRHDLFSWRFPVEYYYAGPKNGKNGQNVVIMYAGGRRVVVDKSAYSQKVLRWARIMKLQKQAAILTFSFIPKT